MVGVWIVRRSRMLLFKSPKPSGARNSRSGLMLPARSKRLPKPASMPTERSKWLLRPAWCKFRHGRSGLRRCRQGARNVFASGRSGRTGLPRCCRTLGTVLCYTVSNIALEVAFNIAVRRISARHNEILQHYTLLRIART